MYVQKRKSDGQFLSGSDDAKSGDDDTGDDNDVVMENNKGTSKQQKEQKKRKEPLLICGDRKRDVRNGNATILHCCDYNPVSRFLGHCFDILWIAARKGLHLIVYSLTFISSQSIHL